MLSPFTRLVTPILLSLTVLTSAISTDLSTLEATNAVVVGHPFPACNGHKTRKSLEIPVDRCFTTPTLALEIKTAATCANGTRAQWARYSEKGCGDGSLDADFGLVDLQDKDIGSCLLVMKFESMAFWCDGVKKTSPKDENDKKEPEDADKSKKGSVSESACMTGRAPFWNHPEADTCVNLMSEKLEVSSAAVCTNGTQSTLALYRTTGCFGAPSEFRAVKEEDSNRCSSVEGMKSFAFYCTGEGIQQGNNHGGGILQFLLVLTLIIMMSLLILIVTVFTWVRKYGGSVGKLIEFARVSRAPLFL